MGLTFRSGVAGAVVLSVLVTITWSVTALLDDPEVPEAVAAPRLARPALPRWSPHLPEPEQGDDLSLGASLRRHVEARCAERRRELEREIERMSSPAHRPASIPRPDVFFQGLDSIGGEGNIDVGAVSRMLRASYGLMRGCYAQSLRREHRPASQIELRFTVGASGRVSGASSSLGTTDSSLDRCMTDVVRRLAFPAPEEGSVDFSFSYLLCP